MKKLLTLCLLFVAMSSFAQYVTFESLPLPSSNYWKGIPGVPGVSTFQESGVTFVNRNDTSSFGDYWSGWGYSATTDTTSVLYSNEMSAITGKGYNNSDKYGVAYLSYNPEINKIKCIGYTKPMRAYFTNTTITYRSMQNGDGFAKKFGGLTGNDPDFLRLDITGWHGGMPVPDTVHFYLADFRDSNNANDYIIHKWTEVNLEAIGPVDSLTYNMVSSDTGAAGMNTPAYFCMDELTFFFLGVNDNLSSNSILAYPNPASDFLMIENKATKPLQISCIGINGQTLFNIDLNSHETKKIDMQYLPKGTYILRINEGEHISYKKIAH